MLPITATSKPQASFFRRRQFRGLESDESEDDSSDSSLSESSSSEEEQRFSQAQLVSSAPAVAVRGRIGGGELGNSYTPPRRGIDIKLSLAIMRSRQLLESSSFAELSVSLKSLAACLPSSSLSPTSHSLGVFAPILFRLVVDLRAEVGRERTKEWREGISSRDATALVGLTQRWDGAKAKGKELEWVRVVSRLVQAVELPPCMTGEGVARTRILNGIESLLLPSSHRGGINLSGLDLTNESLDESLLKDLPSVLRWYLAFSEHPTEEQVGELLDNVRSLDLGHNLLSSIPKYLVKILPNLESLTLSHNQFHVLPPHITSLRSLSRLKTHGNQLTNTRKAKESTGTRSSAKVVAKFIEERIEMVGGIAAVREVVGREKEGVESLSVVCAQVIRRRIREGTTDDVDDLPPHLHSLIHSSYICSSCHIFTPPSSSSHVIPALNETICHLAAGVVLPDFLARQASAASRMEVLESTRRRMDDGAERDARMGFKIPIPVLSMRQAAMLAISHIEKWSDGSVVGYTIGSSSSHPSGVEAEGEDYRFCFDCCGTHLGLEGFEEGWCDCCVCFALREVMHDAGGREGRRVRWFRIL